MEAFEGLVDTLSEHPAWLLTEYGRRYGVGVYFQRLCYLDLLVYSTRTSRTHFELLMSVLRDLHSVKNQPHTRLEQHVHVALMSSLKERVEGLLSRYELMFPTNETWENGALNALVRMTSFVLAEKERVPFLVNCMQSAMRFNYNMSKMNEEQDVKASDAGDCAVLAAATRNIVVSLGRNMQYYAEEFVGVADLVPIVATHYYAMLSDDVIEKFQYDMVLSNEIFELYTALELLHNMLHRAGLSTMQVLSLRKYFQPYVRKTIGEIEPKLLDFASKYVNADNWKPLLPDLKSDDPQLHSSSVLDLFKNLADALSIILKVYFDTTDERCLFMQMVQRVLNEYMRLIVSLCVDELQNTPDLASLVSRPPSSPSHSSSASSSASSSRSHTSTSSSVVVDDDTLSFLDMFDELKSRGAKASVSVVITQALCVRINNLVALKNQTKSLLALACKDRVDEAGRKRIVEAANGIYLDIQSHTDQLIAMITTKMSHTLQATLDVVLRGDLLTIASSGLASGVLANRLQPLIAYLEIELERLSNQLYIEVFNPFLLRVWYTIVRSIEGCLLPIADPETDAKHRPLLARVIEQTLGQLFDFFHAGGDGLPREQLSTQGELLTIVFQLFQSDSSILISMFESLNALEEEQAARGTDSSFDERRVDVAPRLRAAHVLCILACRRHEAEVKKLFKSYGARIQNRGICARFGLPLSDMLIESFACKNTFRINGTLSVTTSAICFDTSLWGATGMHRYYMKNIMGVNKLHSRLLKRDSALSLELDDRTTAYFDHFENRDRVFDTILRAGRALGAPFIHKFSLAVLSTSDPSNSNTAPASPRGPAASGSHSASALHEDGGSFDTPSEDQVNEYVAQKERFKKLFKLGEEEPHILHSLCDYRKLHGEMFISSNFVCWAGKPRLGMVRTIKHPFKDIVSITHTTNKEIIIEISSKKLLFHKLPNFENVFEMLSQLFDRSRIR